MSDAPKTETTTTPTTSTTTPTVTEEEEANALDAGYHLFVDVFRRADKNDDGKISFQEYIAYFQDDHVSNKDMQDLFSSIDSDNSGNIDLKELSAYFHKGFEPYMQLFSSLEHTHKAITNALLTTRQNYQTQSIHEQFKTRFYLKEFLHQLESLHNPVNIALDRIHENTERRREFQSFTLGDEIYQKIPSMGAQNGVYPIGLASSATNLVAASHNRTIPSGGDLHHQVDRLSALIDKLERSAQIKLDLPEEEELASDKGEETEAYTVVCSEMDVSSDSHTQFIALTKEYLKQTKLEDGCHYVYVKKRGDTHQCYYIYEVFTSPQSLKSHYKTAHYKEYAKNLVDVLSKPATVNSLVVPSEWFPSSQE